MDAGRGLEIDGFKNMVMEIGGRFKRMPVVFFKKLMK
ncbi:hypothetical protein CCACVL1_01815, partial [Corchorus capsularis]